MSLIPWVLQIQYKAEAQFLVLIWDNTEEFRDIEAA